MKKKERGNKQKLRSLIEERKMVSLFEEVRVIYSLHMFPLYLYVTM